MVCVSNHSRQIWRPATGKPSDFHKDTRFTHGRLNDLKVKEGIHR